MAQSAAGGKKKLKLILSMDVHYGYLQYIYGMVLIDSGVRCYTLCPNRSTNEGVKLVDRPLNVHSLVSKVKILTKLGS